MSIFIEPLFTQTYQSHPIKLVDIGASGGISDHLNRAKKYMHLIGFEPHEPSYDALVKNKTENSQFFNIALHNEKKEIDFYITRKPTASSMFKPNMRFRRPFQNPEELEIVKTIRIRTDTLDQVCRDNQLVDIDLIKADTQGSELFIFQGGGKIIEESVFAIEVEVEFTAMYEKQPLFTNIDELMRGTGFDLMNLGLLRWQRLSSKKKKSKGQIVAALAHYTRLHSGTSVLIFMGVIIISNLKKEFRKTLKSLAMLALGLIIPVVFFTTMIHKRDAYIAQNRKSAIEMKGQHIIWHAIYIGMSFLANEYGVPRSDRDVKDIVRAVNPDITIYSKEYERIVRNEVFELITSHPLFTVRTQAAKFGIMLMYVVFFCQRRTDYGNSLSQKAKYRPGFPCRHCILYVKWVLNDNISLLHHWHDGVCIYLWPHQLQSIDRIQRFLTFMVLISFIIPVYNESQGLDNLYNQLTDVLKKSNILYEIIFVDDGSQDNSVDVIKTFHKSNSHIKLLSLSRNFGHQIALSAGIDHASGDAIIMMDADLQHPPDVIPMLIDKWKEGYDVVYTIREYSSPIGWIKRITSRLFYAIIQKLSKTPIHANAADFRLINRRAANSLKQFRERHRFLRGLVSWIGFKQVGIPYQARTRITGRTKYTFKNMLNFAFEGLTSFSTIPLYLSIFLGVLVSFFSFCYALVVLYWNIFTDKTIQGWSSIIVLILFLGGVQLICIGIMGDYLGRMYDEIKMRPLYLVKDKLGLPQNDI